MRKHVDERTVSGTAQTLAICDVRQLTALVEGALCPKCLQNGLRVKVVEGQNMGFACKLSMECPSCQSTSSVMSSSTLDTPEKGRSSFEVNKRLGVFCHMVGGSHFTLKKLGQALGMPAMNPKSFQRQDKTLTGRTVIIILAYFSFSLMIVSSIFVWCDAYFLVLSDSDPP